MRRFRGQVKKWRKARTITDLIAGAVKETDREAEIARRVQGWM